MLEEDRTHCTMESKTLDEQIAVLKGMSAGEIEAAYHKPGPLGGHNWHPMSFSPDTGYVYIPALDMPFGYGNDQTKICLDDVVLRLDSLLV